MSDAHCVAGIYRYSPVRSAVSFQCVDAWTETQLGKYRYYTTELFFDSRKKRLTARNIDWRAGQSEGGYLLLGQWWRAMRWHDAMLFDSAAPREPTVRWQLLVDEEVCSRSTSYAPLAESPNLDLSPVYGFLDQAPSCSVPSPPWLSPVARRWCRM